MCQVFTSTAPENCLKKTHNAEQIERKDIFEFFNIQSVAKIEG